MSPNIHFTEDGENQECTTEPCPPHPTDHGTVSFWPIDDDGIPTAPPITHPLAGPVEYQFEDGEEWGPRHWGNKLAELTDGIRAVGTAAINIVPAFGDIYDAIAALMPPPPPRVGKAARARAKRAKLRQRRSARELYRGRPGVDWRESAPMLRMSIASIARDGVPCSPVPCPPLTTMRMDFGPIAVIERTP